jgi:hypothetical protein
LASWFPQQEAQSVPQQDWQPPAFSQPPLGHCFPHATPATVSWASVSLQHAAQSSPQQALHPPASSHPPFGQLFPHSGSPACPSANPIPASRITVNISDNFFIYINTTIFLNQPVVRNRQRCAPTIWQFGFRQMSVPNSS